MQEFKLTVASSPHVRCNETIPKIMWNVVAALVPAAAFGVLLFLVVNVSRQYHRRNCLGSCIRIFIGKKLMHKTRHHHRWFCRHHGPSPGYVLARRAFLVDEHRRSFLAIVVCKQAMGGLGYNIFNRLTSAVLA